MSAFLYLLPLGLIFDLTGFLPPSLRLFLLYGLLALPLCLRPSKKAGLLGLGLLVVMAVGSMIPASPAKRRSTFRRKGPRSGIR